MRVRELCFVLAIVIASPNAFAQAPTQAQQPADRPEDRAALRAILVKGAEALNTRNFDGITPSLHPAFTIVTVDNQKLVGIEQFKKYYQGLFEGPQAVLNKVEVRLAVDEATRFLSENTGVVYGTSRDTYHFKDGDTREMLTRWSAVTQKGDDGWKLVSAHFSANLLDNPVLEAAKSFAKKVSAGAAVAGIVVGALLMLLLRRRPSS